MNSDSPSKPVFIILGGPNGTGKTTGADVAIVDIDDKTGQKTVEEIKSYGRDSLFIHCDVTNKEQVEAMVVAVVRQFGRLDIGVNNAGIGILGGDVDFSLDDWNKVIAVNLTGMYLCAQAEAKQFLKQSPIQGKIINRLPCLREFVITMLRTTLPKGALSK